MSLACSCNFEWDIFIKVWLSFHICDQMKSSAQSEELKKYWNAQSYRQIEFGYTVKPDFSKLFERRKNVYYCQVFTIYHVIYAVIANFGKQQKVY